MRELVLGTRGSALALWQARHVGRLLVHDDPELAVREQVISTEGDLSTRVAFGVGDRGVFVRRIEEALLSGEIDLAVHSLKDLPTEQPEGLVIAAVLERHDARDILLTPDGSALDDLPRGCLLGTGSPRRRSQLLNYRPDLKIEPVRGNVDTRVSKLLEGHFGGIVLAMAGVARLGIDRAPYRAIDPSICLPAVGQGAVAVEVRADDAPLVRRLRSLDHEPTSIAVSAERGFLSRLGGGCLAPATAHARLQGDRLLVDAMVGDENGREVIRDRAEGAAGDAARLGKALATRLLDAGGERILNSCRDSADDGR